jgi:hypothetical protein
VNASNSQAKVKKEEPVSGMISVFRGLKTLFGSGAVIVSFWTALITGFFIGPSIVILLHADGYRPDTFTITKLNHVKGYRRGSQRTYDKTWADGTVAGNQEIFKLGEYIQGTIQSQEDLEKQFHVGQKLAVYYNPNAPKRWETRVLYPEKDFHKTWDRRQKKMINTAYLPLALCWVLCLLFGALGRKMKSAIGFCVGSLFFVAFAWIITLLKLYA